jgi:hypothetical protein
LNWNETAPYQMSGGAKRAGRQPLEEGWEMNMKALSGRFFLPLFQHLKRLARGSAHDLGRGAGIELPAAALESGLLMVAFPRAKALSGARVIAIRSGGQG